MESNDTGPSPGAVKEKLSLRKRLLIKKSTRVGCTVDNTSADRSSTPDTGDFSKSSTNLFLSKRVHENGERTYSSDSEATTSTEASRIPISTSVFLPSAQALIQAPSRPKSMIENNARHKDISGSEKYLDRFPEHCRSSPINKSIEVLKKPHIFKALSDPNCDGNGSVYNGARTLSAGRDAGDSQRRISSSLSEMQHSSDEMVMSDYELVDKSLNESCRDSSMRSSDGASRSRDATNLSHTPRSGSTDSLARNSLLAAKVLRLIPTQKARERNFLHGRLASNSLLGAAELERVFPNREVEIFVGTWNMNGQSPPSELNDFLFPSAIKNVPDILAIGTQESISERIEWEISIQEALGPSHLLLHSTTLGTLHLSVFIRRDLIWFCSLPEDASISVRPGTAFRTKGAVAISFALFGTTFLFVTAHLTAHQEKVKERVHDIKKIIRALDLPKNLPIKHKNKDVTNNFDVVMWCGDLNFRLSEDRASVLRGLAGPPEVQRGLPPGLHKAASASEILHSVFPSVLKADQLSAVLAGGTILKGFREAPIHFAPTYKYDPGTQRFDTSSKQRAPAYTDRILFKTRSIQQASSTLSGLRRSSHVPTSTESFSSVQCLAYDSVPSICSSDHKPVWALFTASLRPGTDIVPLAAGLFNREVYLEGIKRRAAMLDHQPGTSAICSIQ